MRRFVIGMAAACFVAGATTVDAAPVVKGPATDHGPVAPWAGAPDVSRFASANKAPSHSQVPSGLGVRLNEDGGVELLGFGTATADDVPLFAIDPAAQRSMLLGHIDIVASYTGDPPGGGETSPDAAEPRLPGLTQAWLDQRADDRLKRARWDRSSYYLAALSSETGSGRTSGSGVGQEEMRSGPVSFGSGGSGGGTFNPQPSGLGPFFGSVGSGGGGSGGGSGSGSGGNSGSGGGSDAGTSADGAGGNGSGGGGGSDGTGGGGDQLADTSDIDPDIISVPEPGAIALFGAGLLGLGLVAFGYRRHGRKSA